MRINHHGAVNGVTGSCHELQLDDGRSILIDCGLFQGAEASDKGAESSTQEIDFDTTGVQALVVTHVHIDHVGRIPYLLAAGFEGPIYCTEPSAVLLPLVIEDALKVGFTKNRRLIERVIKKLKDLIKPLPYGQWQPVIPLETSASQPSDSTLAIKFKPAGHILGSAYVECEVKEPSSISVTSANPRHAGDDPVSSAFSSKQRVIFSGDLGASYAPLLPAPKSPYGCDVLIIESTYGDRLHQGRRERRKQLLKVLKRALSDNGVVLIPAFSIGRTQELLYEIEELLHQHQLQAPENHQQIEVIVDSPLAARFTEVYRGLKQHWDKEAKNKVERGRHPLSFEELYTIDSHQQHEDTVAYLQKRPRPCIVIAASGMCAGGRIVNYLQALLENTTTDVLLVGYQAKGTPGRIIQQYGPQGGYVDIEGKRYSINAQIHTLSGYSAHADQKGLMNFVKRMKKKPREIRVIHGDKAAKAELARLLKLEMKETTVIVP